MADDEGLGEYRDALKSDRYANRVIRWSGPIIVFGWFSVGVAVVVLALSVIGSLIAIANRDAGAVVGLALGTLIVSAGFALVVILQASIILVFGYYLRMRAYWTRYQVSVALKPDNG